MLLLLLPELDFELVSKVACFLDEEWLAEVLEADRALLICFLAQNAVEEDVAVGANVRGTVLAALCAN